MIKMKLSKSIEMLTWVCILMVLVKWVSANRTDHYSNPEKDALLALKNSLYDPQNVLSSWDPSVVDPCNYSNIICNPDHHVTHLSLASYNFSGQLVPNLEKLEHLQYMEIFKNNIQRSIPPELGNLKSLIELDLSYNQISGTIPPELGNLSSLRQLILKNNKLTGRIPSELFKLNLTFLDLSNHHLTN